MRLHTQALFGVLFYSLLLQLELLLGLVNLVLNMLHFTLNSFPPKTVNGYVRHHYVQVEVLLANKMLEL